MKNLFILSILLAVFQIRYARAQEPSALDAYLQEAFSGNLALKQREISVERSIAALQEARSLFLPVVSLGVSYTHGVGGRSINLPIGDLLNPVYTSLNEILNTNSFPQVENVEEQFFPQHFYDVKIRTAYPVLNPDLRYNREIKSELVTLEKSTLYTYKLELVRTVKAAYFGYLQALEAVEIYDVTLDLVRENLRVNKSLFENDKINRANVVRAEGELSQVLAQRIEAQNRKKNAQAYFNFLLNKNLTDSIVVERAEIRTGELISSMNESMNPDDRGEVAQLNSAISVGAGQLNRSKSYNTPRISAFLDLGAQNQNIKINEDAPYLLLGLQLDWSLFAGKANIHRIRQQELDLQKLSQQKEEVKDQLALKHYTAVQGVLSAVEKYEAGQASLEAAREYYAVTFKSYREGVVNYIELLEARTQYTQAALQRSIDKYDVMIRLADWERVMETYPVN